MAKKDELDNSLGALPPELQVDNQGGVEQPRNETGEVNIPESNDETHTVKDSETGDGSDKGEIGASLGDNEEKLPKGHTALVVTKGNTVRHDGQAYGENQMLTLADEDAQRLIVMGVAADVDALRKRALARPVPAVSVQTGE